MTYSEELAGRVRERLAASKKVTEKEMFGGLAFLVAGNMCCGVHGDELIVRVPPELHQDALTRPNVREMDFTGRPMRGFVTVTRDGTDDDSELDLWVRLGLARATSLPAKAPAKKAGARKRKAPAKKAAARKKTR